MPNVLVLFSCVLLVRSFTLAFQPGPYPAILTRGRCNVSTVFSSYSDPSTVSSFCGCSFSVYSTGVFRGCSGPLFLPFGAQLCRRGPFLSVTSSLLPTVFLSPLPPVTSVFRVLTSVLDLSAEPFLLPGIAQECQVTRRKCAPSAQLGD